MLTAAILLARPLTFAQVLAIDAAALGFGHVVATYLQLSVMPLTSRQRRILAGYGLPFTLLVVLAAFATLPLHLVTTAYVLWSVAHTCRQAYGIDRLYRRVTGEVITGSATYSALLGVAGLLFLASLANGWYLSLPVFDVPVIADGHLRAAGTIAWLGAAAAMWTQPLTGVAARFRWSQLAVFGVGYALMPNLPFAWIVVNVWHNCQYLVIVRNAMAKAARAAEPPKAAALALPMRGLLVIGLCLGLGVVAYQLIAVMMLMTWWTALGPAFAIYIAVNVHHYVVDGLIWKRRSPTLEVLA
jgi:hypothetical protein